MATIPSLPTIDVYLAFNPTYSGTTLVESTTQALPASGDSNDYWTNVSQYVRDFDTQSGRQHFLDRVEAGTLNITLDNRTGFFFNGTLNGSLSNGSSALLPGRYVVTQNPTPGVTSRMPTRCRANAGSSACCAAYQSR